MPLLPALEHFLRITDACRNVVPRLTALELISNEESLAPSRPGESGSAGGLQEHYILRCTGLTCLSQSFMFKKKKSLGPFVKYIEFQAFPLEIIQKSIFPSIPGDSYPQESLGKIG